MKHSTKRVLSKAMTPVLVLILALAAPSFLTAQGRRPVTPDQSLSAAPTANEVYSWARRAKDKLPDSADWDKAKPETETQRSLMRLIKRGHSIIDRAVERGVAMSATEAADYDKQMRTVVEQMDKLSAGASAEGPAACFKECDKAYPGWGKGKGWNRFWCKVPCLKVKVGKVGVG